MLKQLFYWLIETSLSGETDSHLPKLLQVGIFIWSTEKFTWKGVISDKGVEGSSSAFVGCPLCSLSPFSLSDAEGKDGGHFSAAWLLLFLSLPWSHSFSFQSIGPGATPSGCALSISQ